MRRYITLTLRVDIQEDGGLRLMADGPGGQGRADLALPEGDASFSADLKRLAALKAPPAIVERVGRRLFDILFPESLRPVYAGTLARIDADQGLRLVLQHPPEAAAFAALPWEYLHDPARGPLLQRGVSLVRYLAQSTPAPPLRGKLPLRVLLSAAQTAPAANILPELRAVRDALAQLGEQVLVTVEPHLTAAKLRDHLRDGYAVWHFVGHGAAARSGAELVLEDDLGDRAPLGAEALAATLAGSGVRLAVLSACEGAAISGSTLRGIAPALVAAGTPAAIAMQFAVAEESARAFATECYRALARGWPIDSCVAEGRKALAEIAPARPNWGTPVVYTRAADGVLFTLPEAGAAGDPSRQERILNALLHDHSDFINDRLASFVGRAAELAAIRRQIAGLLPVGGYVTITGQAGQGKSSVIARLVEAHGRAGSLDAFLADAGLHEPARVPAYGPEETIHHFIPFSPGPDHQVGLLRNLLARLIRKYGLSDFYAATDSRAALRDYFARALQDVAERRAQEIIYIDGLDQIEEDPSGARDLSFLPTKPPAGIVFVLGTRPNDTLRPLELRKPHQQYWLPNLSREDFSRILASRGVALGDGLADRFYRTMQANALYLDLVARELREAGSLAPEAIIRRIADNPENLFSLAFERLRRQLPLWRDVIKPILGLLLAARAPLSLRVIGALIERDDLEIRDGLQRLGGLVSRDGAGCYTLFHLKLRDYLREDRARPEKEYVFSIEEEARWHRRVAGWCAAGQLDAIWEEPRGDALEQERRAYAREHAVAHLFDAHAWEEVWATLEDGRYRQRKLLWDPSTQAYLLDLDLGRQAAIQVAAGDQRAGVELLPRLWRYSLMRCSLTSRADSYPDQMFEALALLGRELEAVRLAELLTDAGRKVRTLTRIGVLVAEQSGSPEAGLPVLTRALEVARAAHDDGLAEGVPLLIGVADGLRQCGRAGMASDVLDEAYAAAMAPAASQARVDLLALLSQAFARAGRADEAIRAADEALEAARAVANRWSREQKLETAVGAIARLGWVERAGALAAEIDDRRIQGALSEVITAVLTQMGRFDEALERARGFEVLLHKEQWIVSILLRAGRLDEALALAQQADSFRKSYLLPGVAVALVDAGRHDEALAAAQDLYGEPARVSALIDIGLALARGGSPSRAAAALDAARAQADALSYASWRQSCLPSLAAAFARTGRADEAIDLAREIAEPTERTKSLATIAAVLGGAGDGRRAAALLDEIRLEAAPPSSADMEPALETIALALAEAGSAEEALATARLVAAGERRDGLLASVAARLARGGDPAAARVAVQEIASQVVRSSTALHIAQDSLGGAVFAATRSVDLLSADGGRMATAALRLAAAGRHDDALDAARRLEPSALRVRLMAAVAQELARAQRAQAAVAALEEALTIANSLDLTVARVEALTTVSAALHAMGRMALARAALDNALGTARALSQPMWRANMLSLIAQTLGAQGRRDEALAALRAALDTLGALEAGAERAEGLLSAAIAYARLDMPDEAHRALQAVPDGRERARALAALAPVVAGGGRAAEAGRLIDEAFDSAAAIGAADERSAALADVAQALSQMGQTERLLRLIQHYWRGATARGELLQLMPLAHGMIVAAPELGVALREQIRQHDSLLHPGGHALQAGPAGASRAALR